MIGDQVEPTVPTHTICFKNLWGGPWICEQEVHVWQNLD